MSSNDSLCRKVRAAFILQGTTLAAYCRRNSIAPRGAYAALSGTWKGPKADLLRQHLVGASGVTSDPCRQSL
jgi:hypothetical protein